MPTDFDFIVTIGLALLVLWTVFGVVTAAIAQRQGGSWSAWFRFGVTFGLVAWLVRLFPAIDLSPRRECPSCAERIKVQARICPSATRCRVQGSSAEPPTNRNFHAYRRPRGPTAPSSREQSHLRRRMERCDCKGADWCARCADDRAAIAGMR